MIAEALIPLLQTTFGTEAFVVGVAPDPVAAFPAKHPNVGPIEIYEQGNELMVVVGNFSHGHFASYEEGLSESAHSSRISEDVVSFLVDVFADRIEFWGRHLGAGGWRQRGSQGKLSGLVSGSATHVWSGPIATGT